MCISVVLQIHDWYEIPDGWDLETQQSFFTPFANDSFENGRRKINEEDEGTEWDDKSRWIVFIAYIVVTYVLSLRGNEGLMLDLKSLRRNWKPDRGDHFVISLWGKLKGEISIRDHLIPCINVTRSGLGVKT